MRVWLLKSLLSCLELLGRIFIFNYNFPEMGEVTKDISYGSHKKQSLDIIYPEKAESCPVLIFIHGGGWMIGDKTSYRRLGKVLASQGYLVVNVNYRLTPQYQFPVQLQDAAGAINYVYSNIEKYGGNKTQLFLAGDSAGAHLASWYAAALGNEELFRETNIANNIPAGYIKGLLLFYGAYDLQNAPETDFWGAETMVEGFLGTDKELYEKRLQLASPIRHLTKDYPPVFLCSGEKDNLHSESVQFKQELNRLGISQETLFFGEDYKCHHGFLNLPFRECAEIALKKAGRFMNKYSD